MGTESKYTPDNYQFDIPQFKIRASAIGKIMTEPAGKSVREKITDLRQVLADKRAKLETIKPTLKTYANTLASIAKTEAEIDRLLPDIDKVRLSQTCITLLEEWCNQFVYNRRSEFSSKYTDKGNAVEDEAILYAMGHVKELGLASKNLEKFSDEHLQGSPDIITDTHIFDIKSSWSHDTFPLYDQELPESDYAWQVLGYMALTGKQAGAVVFCLMSMPEELIRKEAKWKLGYDYDEDKYQEFADAFRYDDLPAYLRIRQFTVQYDEEKIEAIRKRVTECRQYINDVIVPALERNAKMFAEL